AMASAHGRAGAIDCQRFIESDCQFSRFEGDADKPSLRPHRSPAMTTTSPSRSRSPLALYALAAGAFGIGCAEFVIMGLLLQVAADLRVSLAAAGLLVTGYALGVTAGAPVLTLLSRRMPRKA